MNDVQAVAAGSHELALERDTLSSPWLVSARFDAAVFVLPALLSIAIAACSAELAGAQRQTPTWAWLLFVVGIDVAHVHGTTLRVYLDRREFWRRARLYMLVPLLGLLAGALAYSWAPLVFWRALAYLAVFHFVRQQIGWARLYRRRAGDESRFDAYLEEATLYAATIYPLLVWHTRLPTSFDWFLPGDFVRGLPRVVARIAVVPWALLLLAFFARQLQRTLQGEPPRWGTLLLVTTTAATWWTGIVYFANDFAFTVTNVVAHGLPYMVISFRVGHASPPAAGVRARKPWPYRSFALYALVLWALAFGEEWLWDAGLWHDHPQLFPTLDFDGAALAGGLVPLLALPQIVHYVLDAYLWRLDGSNPGLARALGIRSAAISEAHASTSP